MVLAHRFAYELWVELIPDGMLVHHCDNPACVRPDHLYLGTNQDNTNDMIRRGRQRIVVPPPKTHCIRGHAFTAANTYWTPEGTRRCRACKRAWLAERAVVPQVGSQWRTKDKRETNRVGTVLAVTEDHVLIERVRKRRVTRLRFSERYELAEASA